MATTVIGREQELEAIEAFLAAAEQGPRALVLSGEAGIGKTILWEEGVDAARERFGHVLICRGVEAEASLSFAALSELLGEVLAEVGPTLVPPRRRALEVALLLVEPGEVAPDAHAIGLAVLDVLRALAERAPVLVALDDLQWLDPASAGAIQIALRRLREESVGLLATLRLGPELGSPVELERSFPDERLEQLTLDPLSLAALHRLLENRFELDLTRPELARVQEATAGNPFFALELGRELVRTNTRPAPGQALRVPESLRELLGGRLARLPGETLDVLLLVAALARPTLELVSATYGENERVVEALETAAQEAVVELDNSYVRFAHPLLASICYERAPLWKRRAVHQALAASVSDVEERARHLALAATRPDSAVASELDAAAERAAARGATAAAAELCELATELTPDDPVSARARRLLAARFHRLAGNTDRAVAMLDLLLAEVPSGLERADVLFEILLTQSGGPRTNIEQCDEALLEAEGDDARCARLLAIRAGNHILEADARAALADARAALDRAERVGDLGLQARVIAYLGQAETYHDEITPGLLERGVEIEETLGLELEWNYSPRYVLARRLMRLGETDRVSTILEQMEAQALERGDEISRVMALWPLALVEWLAGRWRRALEHSTAAYELTEQTQHQHALTWIGRAKALVEADLGLVEAARASAEEGLMFSADSSAELFVIVASGVLGRLELALGDLEAAGGRLRELPRRLLDGGMNDPTLTVWEDAIETLVALGELELASEYLEPYELNARRLGSAWAIVGAARCRGLLSAAEGDLESALEAFERSLADAEPFPLERSRTLLCLGIVRRQAQQKRAAREALEGALEIFEELGARLWADKARAELKRISGRAPASDELTESERRVAELAAKGHTNKQIAAELYMGQSTVEAHLSRVYRKLGVRRAGLAASLERVEA
jgi:DNA-binding CsgD family transcriptional regulator